MKLLKLASALACMIMPVTAALAAQSADQLSIQQAAVDDPAHASIPVTIWTPASSSAAALIVISHGTGGGMASHIDTAQALAQAGFVVVAPMHPGDNFQDDSAVGKPQWFVDRSRHVSKVIDFMFSKWEGRERLIPDRVGMFGLSAGATTALIVIGGVPDLDGVPTYCARNPEFVCRLMAPPSTAAGGSGPAQWVHDRRIAAAVLAAPGLGFAFPPSGLAKVKVPVQLWAGAADQTVPYETNGAVVRQSLRQPVDFHMVPGAVHLSFLAPCGPGTPPQLCQDSEGFDRAAFHREFNQSMIAFFRSHIAGPMASQTKQ